MLVSATDRLKPGLQNNEANGLPFQPKVAERSECNLGSPYPTTPYPPPNRNAVLSDGGRWTEPRWGSVSGMG